MRDPKSDSKPQKKEKRIIPGKRIRASLKEFIERKEEART